MHIFITVFMTLTAGGMHMHIVHIPFTVVTIFDLRWLCMYYHCLYSSIGMIMALIGKDQFPLMMTTQWRYQRTQIFCLHLRSRSWRSCWLRWRLITFQESKWSASWLLPSHLSTCILNTLTLCWLVGHLRAKKQRWRGIKPWRSITFACIPY